MIHYDLVTPTPWSPTELAYRRPVRAMLDHTAGKLMVQSYMADQTVPFSVELIRARYGPGHLLVLVGLDFASGGLNVFVFPADYFQDRTKNREFFNNYAYLDMAFLGELPAGASQWTDPGVRIITEGCVLQEVLGQNERAIYHNEPFCAGFKTMSRAKQVKAIEAAMLGYVQNNPFKMVYHLMGDCNYYAKAI